MKTPLRRTSAPWIVAAVTAALCAAFWLPLGSERLNRTTYSPLGNVVATFASAQESLNAHLGGGPPADGSAAAPPALPDLSNSQGEDSSLPAGSPKKAGRRRLPKSGPAKPRGPLPPEPPDKRGDAPSPIEGVAVAPAAPREAVIGSAEYQPELIRDAFEAELAKFPLDAAAANGKVILRLDGLCRWQGHFILKVAVENHTGSDFFVKELSAYDGSAYITLKSYFRLLVEPGRTRVGHVLFDASPGAKVKITLKEDRENGRALEVPVRYPF